jgi:hypothetical protein
LIGGCSQTEFIILCPNHVLTQDGHCQSAREPDELDHAGVLGRSRGCRRPVRRRRHVRSQPGQEQVQRLQGAPPQHVMPLALVSDAAQPLLHTSIRACFHRCPKARMTAVIVLPHNAHLYVSTYTHTRTRIHSQTHVQTRTHLYTRTLLHSYTHIYPRTCTHVHMYIHVHTHVYTSEHQNTHTCTHKRTYTPTRTHTHTYTHTHTNTHTHTRTHERTHAHIGTYMSIL